jgi:hypothetical protein
MNSNASTRQDPIQYVQLYMGFIASGMPDDEAIHFAELLSEIYADGTHLWDTVANICELYHPWYTHIDTRILLLNKPVNAVGTRTSKWVANIHDGRLPPMIKRIVWSRNRGIVADPYIHSEPPGWLVDEIFKTHS